MEPKAILPIFVLLFVGIQCVTVQEEVRNSTQFTFDLYRSAFDANRNTVISPISFRILLSLLYQSTVGDTKKELQNHVYLAHEKHETAQSQRLTLNSLIANPSVKIVNKIYVKNGYTLKQSFAASATRYHSSVEQKDFTKSQQTANEINQFVEEQTNNLIKNLVSPDIFTDRTALLLLNTLYFKAQWEQPFDESDVKRNTFNGIDGRRYPIDFMTGSGYWKSYECRTCKSTIVELPYVEESNTKFWIILPNIESSIMELKNKLNSVFIRDVNANFNSDMKEIWIPKFEIETELDGVAEFRKLGMNSMFDKAEIEAIEDGPNLKVSDAKQKVKIIVNTEGTEAAAASYLAIEFHTLGGEPESIIKFNRPFIYLIMTADTNEPLFIGHFSKP